MKRIVMVCMFIINAPALLCMVETKKPGAGPTAPIRSLQNPMKPIFEHLSGQTWNFDSPAQLINRLILMFEDVERQSGFPLNPVLVVAAIQELTIDVTKIKDPKTGDTPLHTLFDGKEIDFKTERIGRAICLVLTMLGLDVQTKNYGSMTPLECALASDLDRTFPNFIAKDGTIIDQKKPEAAKASESSGGFGSMVYYGLVTVPYNGVAGAASWIGSFAPWGKTEVTKGS